MNPAIAFLLLSPLIAGAARAAADGEEPAVSCAGFDELLTGSAHYVYEGDRGRDVHDVFEKMKKAFGLKRAQLRYAGDYGEKCAPEEIMSWAGKGAGTLVVCDALFDRVRNASALAVAVGHQFAHRQAGHRDAVDRLFFKAVEDWEKLASEDDRRSLPIHKVKLVAKAFCPKYIHDLLPKLEKAAQAKAAAMAERQGFEPKDAQPDIGPHLITFPSLPSVSAAE